MDASIAMNFIQRIVDRPADFCPKNPKTGTLSEVLLDPKYTEIIFVTPRAGRETLRLEAEIESVKSGPIGKYQIGHTRLFQNDWRNKRVEITTVDIEKYETGSFVFYYPILTMHLLTANSTGL